MAGRDSRPDTPPEKITVGTISSRISGLLYIAETKGYFTAQELDITVKDMASTPVTVQELKAGQLDLACLGAFNLVKEAFAGLPNSVVSRSCATDRSWT